MSSYLERQMRLFCLNVMSKDQECRSLFYSWITDSSDLFRTSYVRKPEWKSWKEPVPYPQQNCCRTSQRIRKSHYIIQEYFLLNSLCYAEAGGCPDQEGKILCASDFVFIEKSNRCISLTHCNHRGHSQLCFNKGWNVDYQILRETVTY